MASSVSKRCASWLRLSLSKYREGKCPLRWRDNGHETFLLLFQSLPVIFAASGTHGGEMRPNGPAAAGPG
jgi:hypothetical protein